MKPLFILLWVALATGRCAAQGYTIEYWGRKDNISQKLWLTGQRERYAANGKLIARYSGGGSSILYRYNAVGLLERIVEYGSQFDSVVTWHNDHGHPVRTAEYGGQGEFETERYVYRSDGLLDTLYTRSLDKDHEVYTGFTCFRYDDEQRKTGSAHYSMRAKYPQKRTYRYWSDTAGHEVREYVVNGQRAPKIIGWTRYDNRGLLKELRTKEKWEHYKYAYRPDGDWSVRKVYEAVSFPDGGDLGVWRFAGEYRKVMDEP